MIRNFPTSGAAFWRRSCVCAPVAVRPCLFSLRTQRRIQSLRNKCCGGRARSIQQQLIRWKKEKNATQDTSVPTQANETVTHSNARLCLSVGGRSRPENVWRWQNKSLIKPERLPTIPLNA